MRYFNGSSVITIHTPNDTFWICVIDDAGEKISSLFELYKEKNDREAEKRDARDPSASGKFTTMSDTATRIVADVLFER